MVELLASVELGGMELSDLEERQSRPSPLLLAFSELLPEPSAGQTALSVCRFKED
jgi:hypothetical protein